MIPKSITLSLLCLMLGYGSMAQSLKISDQASSVKFSIKNFGLQVSGSFSHLDGHAFFDVEHPEKSNFFATVESATVNTGNGSRDKHLNKAEYFNAVQFPKIQLASAKVKPGSKPGEYLMEAVLTIKGVSKFVNLPFTATAIAEGWLYKGELKINRRDFNVGGKSVVLSDNVLISLTITAIKK